MRKDSRGRRSGICKGQKVVSEEWDLGASACDTQQAALHGPNTGRGWGVIGTDSPSGCLASAPGQGLSATVAAAPTSRSPAGISHHSKRSAQMHRQLQELLMQDGEISVWVHSPRRGRALMPVTLMCLLLFSQAQPVAPLCLPLPLGR